MVKKCIELIRMIINSMNFFKKITFNLFLFFGSVNFLVSQESFILNYEDRVEATLDELPKNTCNMPIQTQRFLFSNNNLSS